MTKRKRLLSRKINVVELDLSGSETPTESKGAPHKKIRWQPQATNSDPETDSSSEDEAASSVAPDKVHQAWALNNGMC